MATHSEALLEAYASCPPQVRIYDTLEIYQSSFDAPARVVTGVAEDKQFGIEIGATFNSGEMVTFLACPFYADHPEQREGLPPQCTVKIDNVNRELLPKLRAALGVREYIKVTYRQYLSSDLTEPAFGPVEFLLKEVEITGATLTGTAMVANLVNKRFPRLDQNYDYVRFPSLLP